MKTTAKSRIKKCALGAAALLLGGLMFVSPVYSSVAMAAAAEDYVSEYRSETKNADDVLAKANELNQRIVEEGIVLMKNQNNALPMSAGNKITVLGKNASDPIYGGGGSASGADGSGQGGVRYYNLYDSLENAGFKINPVTRAFYDDDRASGSGRDGGSGTGQVATLTGETPQSMYTDDVKASYEDYNDAAIVFIARAGGEGADLRTSYRAGSAGRSDYSTDGNAATGDHYLELDDNEEALIEQAKANFDKVIIVLDMGTSFELGGLEADEGIDGIVWLGFAGGSGINALGKVLNGEVNPSGRTADIYGADFKAEPTFANFATNYTSSYKTEAGGNTGVNYVEYDEGIYIGYRYYETRGFVEGGDWYDQNVVYPFGYGLSYTTFEWDVNFKTAELDVNGDVVVDVTVTNTGDVAGKDVVELYYSAPYTEYEIEKSHVVLGGYEKTDLIQPGMSDTVTITMSVRTMASYDYNDANANGIEGYELDDGDYTIYVGKNSHVWADADAASKVYTLEDEHYYETDEVSGTKVENQFDYMSDYFDENADSTFAGHSKLMSRTDFEGTFPQPPTTEEAQISSAEQSGYAYSAATPAYDEGKPWYSDEMPEQAAVTEGRISATRMVGLDYDDPRWDTFMNQLSLSDMRDMIVSGYFWTIEIPELDIPQSITPDGPTGFVQGSGSNWVGNTCFYASPIVVASTWNKELAREMGEMVGEEGIWGGEQGVQGGYNGWYAPGNNIHRSPFSGRNFEYYSEDPLLAGTMCAEVVAGAQSRGVFVMIKHFALNDQETNRGNLATWADEQTIREIYLKAFEYSVKAGATGMMSAFNRMGNLWAGQSYELLTQVLRNEWGFRGLVITDWVNGFMRADLMIRAGNDLWLARGNANTLSIDGAALTPTHATAIRNAAKNIIYTVVNSNAMNRLGARYSEEFYKASQRQYSLDLGAKNVGDTVEYDAASEIYSGYEYVLYNAPEGITINAQTGAISGTIAQNAVPGEYAMTVSLKDENGFIGQSATFDVTVNGGLKYVGATAGTAVKGLFSAIDVSFEKKGATVTYELTSGTLPAGMALTADGRIVGVPTSEGSATVEITANANGESPAKQEVTITVGAPGTVAYAPTLAGATVGTAYSANIATATGADNIVYSVSGLPAGLAYDKATGTITGTPEESGEFTVTLAAIGDGCLEATVVEVTLAVEGSGEETPDPDQPGGDEETPDPDQPGGDETPDPDKPGDEGGNEGGDEGAGCGAGCNSSGPISGMVGALAAVAVVLVRKLKK